MPSNIFVSQKENVLSTSQESCEAQIAHECFSWSADKKKSYERKLKEFQD